MNIEVQYIFDIIRYVFQCGECPKLDETVDLKKVYEICDKHHLESIVACGLSKAPYKKELPQDVYNKFISSWKLALIVDTAQQNALKELTEELEKHEIDYMPLKGIYIKKLYPSSELRKMSDLDILYPLENEKAVHDLMMGLGYELDYLNAHHNVYQKKPFVNVEMHQNLVHDTSRFDDYYKDIFSRVDKKSNYGYEMNWDDFYIFHMVHFIKHFITAGCGIRFLVDQYVLQTKLEHKLDRKYVDAELKKIGVYDFEQHMIELTKHIFGGVTLNIYEEEVIQYMMDSGIYGLSERLHENEICLTGDNFLFSKFKNWMHIIFLPLRSIRTIYPYVDKYPILLPVGWVHRWIRSLFFRRKRIKETVNLNTVDNDVLAKRKAFLNKVGVNERYL